MVLIRAPTSPFRISAMILTALALLSVDFLSRTKKMLR
jgi:hypothetical protein